jgi:hypothetical protein
VDCDCAGQATKPTPISLQNHNSEAWFRDLKVREYQGSDTTGADFSLHPE